MSGAEIVALASVVVSGITAAVAPIVAARAGERRIDLETRRDRENELRIVLENAGVKLTEAIAVLDGVRGRLSTLDYDQLALLHAEVVQLWRNEDRIAVRLGRRATETQCYRRSIDRIDEALITCRDGLADGFSERDFEGITAARNAAYQAQRQFYDAASERVGPGETGYRSHAVADSAVARTRYDSSRNSLRLGPAVRRMLPRVPTLRSGCRAPGPVMALGIVGGRMMWWLPRMRLRYQPFASSALMTCLPVTAGRRSLTR